MLNSLVAPSKNKSYDFSHLEENLLKDAPWGKLSHNVAIPASIEQMTKKDALKVMNDIATKSQRAFFGGFAEAQKEKLEKGQADAASEKFRPRATGQRCQRPVIRFGVVLRAGLVSAERIVCLRWAALVSAERIVCLR